MKRIRNFYLKTLFFKDTCLIKFSLIFKNSSVALSLGKK